MNDLFKEKKVRRWAVIVLSYLVCFVVLFITTSIVGEEESAKTFLKLNLIFTVLSFPSFGDSLKVSKISFWEDMCGLPLMSMNL